MMNRRDFMKAAVVTSVAAVVPAGWNPFVSTLPAQEKPDLVAAMGTSPAKITRAAIDGLGGIRRFISRGDIVVIKPNIGWDRTPEYAANTNPEVVAEIVRLCFEAGAKKVKIFDNPVSDARRTYKQSGIADAATKMGAIVDYIDDRKFRDIALKGQVLKSWPLYTEVLEADKVINAPIAKNHGIAKLTLGMKNWMGVMGGARGRIHQRIDESLVDIAMHIRPALIVLDAVRILVENGPQGGSLSDVRRLDTVIAGTDQVAVDAYGTTLFGMKENALGCVRIGHKAGLGNMNLSGQRIKKIQV
jgi:uncharacterized protein (DUF362 family)